MQKDDLETLIAEGKGFREISRELGVSLATIRHWARKYQLQSPLQRWNVKPHKCERCGETDSENFYGNRKAKCKRCFVAEDVAISVAKKKKAVAYMGGKCLCCDYNAYYGALQFHHVKRDDKEDWNNLRNWGWPRIERELSKCVMVCAVCHAEIHGGLIDDSEFTPGPPSS